MRSLAVSNLEFANPPNGPPRYSSIASRQIKTAGRHLTHSGFGRVLLDRMLDHRMWLKTSRICASGPLLLDHCWTTAGPQAACGPAAHFVHPGRCCWTTETLYFTKIMKSSNDLLDHRMYTLTGRKNMTAGPRLDHKAAG